MFQLGIQISGGHLSGQIGGTYVHPGVFIHLPAEKPGTVGPFFPDNLRAFHQGGVIHQQGSSLSGNDILGLVETVTAQMADRAEPTPSVAGTDALGGVFNHIQAVPLGNFHDCIHFTSHTRVMNHANGAGAVRDGRFYQRLVNILRIRPDIHEYGNAAAQHKRVRRGDERIGRHDNLVAWAAVDQQGRHLQCGGSGMNQQNLSGAGAFRKQFMAFFRVIAVSA